MMLYIGLQAKFFEFENFLSNFEKALSDTTSCSFLFNKNLCDFNGRFSIWWTRDKTTIEEIQIESLTTEHGSHQLISQPNHPIPQTSFCIDLMFTDQPNLIINNCPSFITFKLSSSDYLLQT